jgi:hypothetical protein
MIRNDGTGSLNFDWGSGSPSPACGFPSNNFSVRWTRKVYFSAGTYQFNVTSDDGFRLYVDGVLKLKAWIVQGATKYSINLPLSAGYHTIQLRYYENGGGAVAKLSWKSSSQNVYLPYVHKNSSGWATGIACQNLSQTDSAYLTLSFYPEANGTAVFTYSDPNPVEPGKSRGYFTPSYFPGLPSGFKGTAVVSAVAEIFCSTNTQKGSGTSLNHYRVASSAGFRNGDPSPRMFLPQVMKEFYGWSSTVAVQNASSSAVSVTISFRDRFGNSVPGASQTATIPARAGKFFNQSSNSGLPKGFLGAATVVSNDGTFSLVATTSFFNSDSSYSTAHFHSYNGVGSGAGKLLIPRVVRNYYGYNSGISIQNVGSSATSVTITFTFVKRSTKERRTYVYASGSIGQGAALALYLPNVSELSEVDSLSVWDRSGNAVVEAAPGGQIIAIVNESNPGGSGIPIERAGQGATYNAILDGRQTRNIMFPQFVRRAGGVFSSGIQVSNTTGNDGSCHISYDADPDANEDVYLPPNGSIARYAPNVRNLNDGYNASVTVTCTQPVVGIVNLAADPGTGKLGDSFTQANGLNR